jgi:hypothetical protein
LSFVIFSFDFQFCVWEMCRTGEVLGEGNAQANKRTLRKCIAQLDADKQHWRNLLYSPKEHGKWVSENDGALLKN